MSDRNQDLALQAADPKTIQDLTGYVQTMLQQMQDKFQNMSDRIVDRMDDVGGNIDKLEKSVADLMTQAGVDNQ